MQDRAATLLQVYMQENGLNQRDIAKKAGVSQATVSRALRNEPIRNGRARAKIFTFLNINESIRQPAEDELRKRVMAAFDRIWDHTEEHADAIARIIDVLGEFGSPSGRGQRS
jgi:transcriptional regulator with XRE-family HTH domain